MESLPAPWNLSPTPSELPDLIPIIGLRGLSAKHFQNKFTGNKTIKPSGSVFSHPLLPPLQTI